MSRWTNQGFQNDNVWGNRMKEAFALLKENNYKVTKTVREDFWDRNYDQNCITVEFEDDERKIVREKCSVMKALLEDNGFSIDHPQWHKDSVVTYEFQVR